ncbi:MAG: hypothetical protein IPJ88_02900 [Myxococcales bacterium]|nr:MAG: hypothetical protein IPJ88_02900 [Myxococcales bacterium]
MAVVALILYWIVRTLWDNPPDFDWIKARTQLAGDALNSEPNLAEKGSIVAELYRDLALESGQSAEAGAQIGQHLAAAIGATDLLPRYPGIQHNPEFQAMDYAARVAALKALADVLGSGNVSTPPDPGDPDWCESIDNFIELAKTGASTVLALNPALVGLELGTLTGSFVWMPATAEQAAYVKNTSRQDFKTTLGRYSEF